MQRVEEHLMKNEPVRKMEFDDEEEKILKHYQTLLMAGHIKSVPL